MSSSPLILDSVTHLKDEHRARAAHCASHGGIYAGAYAAAKGIGGLILNDAGVGRARAGLAGIELLQSLGVPAATVGNRTARIGDGQHGYAHGRLSFVNDSAAGFGLTLGMSCREALERLSSRPLSASPKPPMTEESRFEAVIGGKPSSAARIIVMDSISLVAAEDAGQIVIAASHGALLAGKPETAVKYDAYAVVTNDADRGIDDIGISRLPALDGRGIAGACVSAFSSRIGDGRSQWEEGYISVVNPTAHRRGGRVGQSTKEFAAAMLEAKAAGL